MKNDNWIKINLVVSNKIDRPNTGKKQTKKIPWNLEILL